MPADYSRILPLGLAALAMLVIYRRLRRSIGPQLISPIRMGLRIALLVLLGVSLLRLALRSTDFLAAEGLGAALGVALGSWGAKHTRFQRRGGALYFVPHTYTGIAVSLLLVGRLAYRFAQLRASGGSAALPAAQFAPSVTTTGLMYVVVGYYLCYYGWVLWKSGRIKPGEIEAAPSPS